MHLNKQYKTLRLILGDQLNRHHSWFSKRDDSILYVIAELKQETDYVKHHIQKICSFFAAMSVFYEELLSSNHHVLYLNLDETSRFSGLDDVIRSLAKQYSIEDFQYQRPDEYRLVQELRGLDLPLEIIKSEFDTEHFLISYDEIPNYIRAKQHNRMEVFYRKLRRRFNILMQDGEPIGEKWNYDEKNREKIKTKDFSLIPKPLVFKNHIKEIKDRIDRNQVSYIGVGDDTLIWPISRGQSLELLSYFCKVCLPQFGRFQDAMTGQHIHRWSLFHSRLSFSLNSKMLSPKEVIDKAIKCYQESEGKISLSQIEGFIRQILGWREYVRCVYWVNMPEYEVQNMLDAKRSLPGFFWDAETNMECLKQAIHQSLEYAYAHHIQRLMITGNFCLLSGIEPSQVDEWYLGIYVDAIEWVEMPNTRGMSQFADGGWVATKPYSSGGNYINKMSDYCKSCSYNIKEKSTENACPMNSLYWRFMDKNRSNFERNARIGMVYRNWDKQSLHDRDKILARAEWCLENIEKL